MALIVLDASVVIAHVEGDDALHGAAERALTSVSGMRWCVPASAYAEALVGPERRGRGADARAVMAAIGLEVVPISQVIAEQAAKLRARRGALGLPDALVLATGEVLEADVVLTGDARWRCFGARVRVI